MSDINTRREEFLRRLLGDSPDGASATPPASEGGGEVQTPQYPALAKIEALLGAQPLKVFARELTTVAQRAKRHGLSVQECMPSLLISISPGNGLSTSLELLADLLDETSLFRFSSSRRVREMKVRHDREESSSAPNTIADLEKLIDSHDFRGLIALDISEYMGNRLHETFFQNLLTKCWEYSSEGEAIFAFVVPSLESQALEHIRNTLNDRLSVRVLAYPPVSQELLLEYAKNYFKEHAIQWPQPCDDLFLKALHAERSDGQFYGFSTARKLCQQITYYKLSTQVEETADQQELAIAPDDLLWVLPAQDATVRDAMAQLDELIGLESIKERVQEIIASIKYQNRLLAEGRPATRPMLHMVFSGPPGTGKTTVARIIGKIFKQEGILEHGNFIEVTRRDLVGRYIGHTAVLTTDVCRSAHGSIMFIDEAYALVPDSDHADNFGLEAIATLITEMENNRDRMCVIMAGYAKDMDRLLDANAGLRDRFAFRLEFDSYSKEQLAEIFFLQMGNLYDCSQEFRDAVNTFFMELPDEVMKSDTFSNARFVRNLYERVISKAAIRQHVVSDSSNELQVSDFDMAVADKDFQKLIDGKEKSRRVGFLVEEALTDYEVRGGAQ